MYKKKIEQMIADFTNAFFKIADAVKRHDSPSFQGMGHWCKIDENYVLLRSPNGMWGITTELGSHKCIKRNMKTGTNEFSIMLHKYLSLYDI